MASSNPVRFMQNDSGSDEYGLAIKMFWGSVVEAFRDESIIFQGDVDVVAKKVLSNTNAAQFLMLADTPDSEDHTPGNELLGQPYAVGDGTITIDGFVVSHHDVPLDQMMGSQFDIVSLLGGKMGKRLARNYDQKMFNLGVNAARTAAKTHTATGLNIHNGGNKVLTTTSTVAARYPVSATGAQNFRADAANLAQLMDDDFVPESGRNLFITPYIRRVLGQDSTIFDQRFTPGNPNRLDNRIIGILEGFNVQVAKGRIPSTNVTGYSKTKYNGNFLNAGTIGEPCALALCGASEVSAAIGTVMLQNIIPEMVKDIRRSTMFMKASILMGADVLHPWCAGTIECKT